MHVNLGRFKKMSIKFVNNNAKPLKSSSSNNAILSQKKSELNPEFESLNDIFSRLVVSAPSDIGGLESVKRDIERCLSLSDVSEQRSAAVSVALIVSKLNGSLSLSSDNVLNTLKSSLESVDVVQREGTLLILNSLLKFVNGKRFVPFFLSWLPSVLEKSSDKTARIRQLAVDVANSIIDNCHPFSVDLILPILYTAMDKTGKWQMRQLALKLLASLASSSLNQISIRLPEIIPHVAECMSDMKADIKREGYATMTKLATVIDSKDIEKVIPSLVECIGDPSTVPQCIKAVSGTTFVRDVESPVLAIMIPLLVRALAVRNNTPMLRQTTVIIDNMCKLVKDPDSIFVPLEA